jgi:hypothetical protein
MSKLDVQKLFDALCDVVLHELSAKEILRQIDERRGAQNGDIMKIIGFVQDERRNRNLPPLDFSIKPEGLKLGWNEWNSGGGCMIWSCDLADGKSIHLTDEVCFLVSLPSGPYWAFEDYEDQAKYHLAECDMNDVAQGRDVDYLFTPFVGQERADLIQADINTIAATF